MELTEARDLHRELERSITARIQEFERQTQMRVEHINVEHVPARHGPMSAPFTSAVEVKVSLR